MLRWALVLAVVASPVWAGDQLDGAGITQALTGKVLAYDDGSTQSFQADGETIHTKGRESIGHRQVQGDRYCSVWPPSDHWACYDVRATQGNRVWVWVVALKFFDMGFRYRTRRGTPLVPNMFSHFTHGFPNAIALEGNGVQGCVRG